MGRLRDFAASINDGHTNYQVVKANSNTYAHQALTGLKVKRPSLALGNAAGSNMVLAPKGKVMSGSSALKIILSCLLTIVLLMHVVYGKDDAEVITPNRYTADAIQDLVKVNLVPGVSRAETERLLETWGISFEYWPIENFARTNVWRQILTPPGDATGALLGAIESELKQDAIPFGKLVKVVVYMDSENKILAASSKTFGVGP